MVKRIILSILLIIVILHSNNPIYAYSSTSFSDTDCYWYELWTSNDYKTAKASGTFYSNISNSNYADCDTNLTNQELEKYQNKSNFKKNLHAYLYVFDTMCTSLARGYASGNVTQEQIKIYQKK